MIEHDRDLFVRELQELYRLEADLEELQAELAESATDEELTEYFTAHGETTTEQLGRLERLYDALEIEAEPDTTGSTALEGLREERDQIVADLEDPVLGDLVETELARSIERLEITRVETLLALADRMDLANEVVDELETTKAEMENGLSEVQELTEV